MSLVLFHSWSFSTGKIRVIDLGSFMEEKM